MLNKTSPHGITVSIGRAHAPMALEHKHGFNQYIKQNLATTAIIIKTEWLYVIFAEDRRVVLAGGNTAIA